MKKELYVKYLAGNIITHCAVLDSENIVFGIKEGQATEDDERPIEDMDTIVLSYAPKRLKENSGFGQTRWEAGIKKVFVSYPSLDTGIVYCDTDFNTYEAKILDTDYLPVVPTEKQDDYTRKSNNIACIAGEIYIVGILRKVFKRTGVYTWVDLTDEIKHPYLFSEMKKLKNVFGNYGKARVGFTAIDGFSADDIYAGGISGDTWHFDGKYWKLVDIPGNFDIKTITCADDDNVYIAGSTGGVIKGRGDKWEKLEPNCGYMFNSSTWFKGKLYLGGDYRGIHVLDENVIRLYEFPESGRVQYSFYGGVASSKEILVSYGEHQALIFDGECWTEILGTSALTDDG